MNFRGKKVFLTGHTGFKGGWLLKALHMLGAEVCGYSLAPNTNPALFEALSLDKFCHHHVGDIRDLAKLQQVVSNFKPDIVFHLAAQPLVRLSYREPIDTFATNVMGTVNLLEACRSVANIEAVIIVTTDKVYENSESIIGYREGDALGGYDPYASSKACAELVTAAYRRSFFGSTPIITARAGNIIGGGDWSEDRLIPDATKAFAQGKPVQIRNTESIRPWQHVLEPVRGYLQLAQKACEAKSSWKNFAFNFGPPESAAWPVQRVMENFCKAWGHSAHWEHTPLPNQPKETAVLKLNSELAQQQLHWQSLIPLEQALQMTAEWYKLFYQGSHGHNEALQQLSNSQVQEFIISKLP